MFNVNKLFPDLLVAFIHPVYPSALCSLMAGSITQFANF